MYTWLIAIPIILLLLWLAWRRPNRQRLLLRLLASAVAGISLTLFVFPPVTKQAINPSAVILLTEGYNPDTLEALLNKQETKPAIYSLNTNAEDATSLSNLHTLRQKQPGLRTVHLLGYGLEEQQLQILDGILLVPHLSALPPGISAVQWPQEIKLGDALNVAGKYTSEGKTKLYLLAAGQLRDSVEINPDSTLTFTLNYTPKQSGRFIYTLLAKTDAKTDTLGQVPVQVKAQQQLSILLLASAPSFEFKFLKNHLSEQHKIAYHIIISKGISQSEWVNMPKLNLNNITAKLLQNFDLVITDPQALLNMSTSERATIKHAVTEDGLGVLTIASEPAINRSVDFFTAFQSKRLSQHDTRTVSANWAGDDITINVSPYSLLNTSTITGLITEQKGNLLAGARKEGWGKVALSYIPQTFPWRLEGKDKVYASYWATLLTAIAKPQVKDKLWHLDKPMVPKPGKPASLSFTNYTLSNSTLVPAATITTIADSVTINLPLAQKIHQPEKFNGTFWPRSSGWHKAETPDAEPYFFYVQLPSDWEFENILDRKDATEAFTAKQSITANEVSVAYQDKPLSLVWFFALFVLSTSFLWLEEKL